MKLRVRIAILAVIAAPTPAFGQSQTQQDRIDEVSRFVVTAPICGWIRAFRNGSPTQVWQQ
jgi:hypothetical protein